MSEEIVQETFEVAIKNIDKFKGESKISTWLCQIAKYIWYKTLKKEKKIDKVNKYYLEENMLNAVKLLKEHQTKNRRLEEFEVDEK